MSEAIQKALSCGLLSALLLIALPASAQGYEPCGPLYTPGVYGPIDYRKMTAEQKRLVEGAHFTPNVESLIRGNTSAIGGDISYTLHAFPNHPRALFAMMKLFERNNGAKPRHSRYTMDCWFNRAMRFQPDDGAVRLLYGIYLSRQDKNKQAIEQLETASRLLGDHDGNAHYNLGLAYVEVGQYDKALIHAHKAYKLGFNLPGLRDKLERAGKWKDPAPTAPAAAAAESAVKESANAAPHTPESTAASTESETAPDAASHSAPSDTNGPAGNANN